MSGQTRVSRSSLPLLLKSVTLYSWLWENQMVGLGVVLMIYSHLSVNVVIMRIERVGLWDSRTKEEGSSSEPRLFHNSLTKEGRMETKIKT